jgi:hypothetical protein
VTTNDESGEGGTTTDQDYQIQRNGPACNAERSVARETGYEGAENSDSSIRIELKGDNVQSKEDYRHPKKRGMESKNEAGLYPPSASNPR